MERELRSCPLTLLIMLTIDKVAFRRRPGRVDPDRHLPVVGEAACGGGAHHHHEEGKLHRVEGDSQPTIRYTIYRYGLVAIAVLLLLLLLLQVNT